jgi:2-keto-4-pentenoate hydratase/2-oxohepta-3-ene-1,7-dioic acid hydratase in catechol pathway
MRLVGYLQDGVRQIGSVDGDRVTPLGTVEDFYAGGSVGSASGEPLALADLTQVPPYPETAKVFCIGMNYQAHIAEASGAVPTPKEPMIFGRWESTLVVDGTPVPIPPNEEGLDWEVELAAVIGKQVWDTDAVSAMDAVMGYTTFNDLSARRKQLATAQFTLGKNPDRSGPIGPVLVTADEIPDPQNLRVTTKVNGETVQDGNTKNMIYTIGEIIAYISDTMTINPGDIIATGTPEGVGFGMTPKRYLKDGDVVEVEVESIGAVCNPIVNRDKL